MSNVERLLTRPERELAAEAQDVLDRYRKLADAMPATVTFPAMRELQKVAAPRQGKPKRRPFTMSDDDYLMLVMRAIRDLPGKDRPHTVALAFMACHASLDWDTDRVLLSREELAKEVGVSPAKAGEAMDVLIRMGVASKEYVPVPGMRGRGRVIYSISPYVVWKGSLDSQEAAKATHAPPRLVHDADADTRRKP